MSAAYQAYLRSPGWRAKREWALERADNRCQVCNGNDRLEVHHRTYENLGAERPGDLTVLCHECHGLYHAGAAEKVVTSSPIPLMGAERAVLLIVARDRERRRERTEALVRHLGPEDFTDQAWRAVFQAFLSDAELNRTPDGMDVEAARRLDGLLGDRTDLLHAERAFGDAIAQMRLATMERCCRDIDRRMNAATDESGRAALAEERAQLAREGREIGLGWSHARRAVAPA